MEHLQGDSEGLTYMDQMPLRLRPAEAATNTSGSFLLAARNEILLRVSIALQDHHEVAERDEFGTELARLDLKIDLIIACLQQMLVESEGLPAPVPVTLTSEGISWPAACGSLLTPDTATPGPGSSLPVLAEIFINPIVPMPLSLHGTLLQGGGTEGDWEMVFDAPGEQVRQLLEKLIFRYHLHAVAVSAE